MASLLNDGYHKVIVIKEPVNNEDIEFVKDFANKLLVDCSRHIEEPFLLKIGEFHCGREEHTWQIEIQSINLETCASNIDDKKPLIRVESEQYYFGRSSRALADNYSGRIEIAVTMANRPGIKENERFSRISEKLLLRLTYMHYYECIASYYTKWETDYINAPKYYEYTVDTANKNWREYDEYDEHCVVN